MNSSTDSTPLAIHEIAARLLAFCKAAKWETAQRELYADDAVSIEPQASPAFARQTDGLAAIIEKGRKFSAMIETMHAHSVSGPLLSAHSFALQMSMDVTMKGEGRMQMSELAIYEVRDGKIVSERFFP